jgi:hypothetical protein
MAKVVEETAGKIRDKPITAKLKEVLSKAADAAGIEKVVVVSGGQAAKGSGGKRTGSTRHDLGHAADLQLVKAGKVLDFTKSTDLPKIISFVKAAVKFGATGLGAGVSYMGAKTLHVGFGSRAVWGAGGKSGNAPAWLREAVASATPPSAMVATASRFRVSARHGLHLRSGPGTEFGVSATLEAGTVVTVSQFDGISSDWARADLEGDGLVDGHVHRSFLVPLAEDGGHHLDSDDEEIENDLKPARASRSRRKRRGS